MTRAMTLRGAGVAVGPRAVRLEARGGATAAAAAHLLQPTPCRAAAGEAPAVGMQARVARIRVAREVEDVTSAADICATAFGALDSGGAKEDDPEWLKEVEVKLIQAKYDVTKRELEKNANSAIDRRRVARIEDRLLRVERESARMRQALSQQGEPEVAEAAEVAAPAVAGAKGSAALKDRQRRSRRMWHLLLADDAAGGNGGRPVGSCTVCMFTPDALLPPPFPTTKPEKLYLSNMAVVPEYRRRGVAKELLAASERLARRWGRSELWLHVDLDNPTARILYESEGYVAIGEDPWVYTLALTKRRLLMKKVL